VTIAVQPVRIAAAAVVGTTLIAGGAAPTLVDSVAAPVATGRTTAATFADQVVELAESASKTLFTKVSGHARHAAPDGKSTAGRPHAPRHAAPVYRNPLRDISDLIPERIDMGVDFGGAGPVFAMGDGVVISATSESAGWPGGGWITYQLTDGPDKGLVVYFAEDVTPTVQVGEHVTPDTVIGNMYNGGDGIETGWAQPNGESAESQLAVAGGISGWGPFPTEVGLNYEELLQELGVPAALNRDDAPFGLLPAGYPTSWPGISAG
jgi:murein DD-endopeptidase MepM/ murein hydrolase activator NlpD